LGAPEVLTDLAAVEHLLPEWRELCATSATSALEAPDWLLPLARRYLTRYDIRFLAWREEGRLIGVAPLALVADRPPIRPVRRLEWWGSIGPRMRGLNDVVAVADQRDAVLQSLCDWLDADGRWDVLHLVRPQFESPTPEVLRRRAPTLGWSYNPYANLRSTTYQLDLPDTEQGWQQHLGSKARKVMRWELRKFAERGGAIVAAAPPAETDEALEAVERLLRERWGDNEVYFARDARFRGLLHESIPALVQRGDAWLTVARDADGIQGVLVSVAQNGFGMALMVAMTSVAVYRPFSLGKHLFDAGLAEGVRRGCRNYDFLWVGGYKESFWHATPRLLESAMVGRGLIGRQVAKAWARRESGPLDGSDDGSISGSVAGSVFDGTAESTRTLDT
jgi:CelD/BcsL family acetyltransferase involved in cellulose biosynthesis